MSVAMPVSSLRDEIAAQLESADAETLAALYLIVSGRIYDATMDSLSEDFYIDPDTNIVTFYG